MLYLIDLAIVPVNWLTLVASDSAKEAALSMGLNVGDPVESLATNMTRPAPRTTKTRKPILL